MGDIMKKREIIKKNDDFSLIINTGKKVKNDYYSIFYKESATNLYGISIPTKTGKAVVRNKIKRQIKNIIDHNKKYIQKTNYYVIIIKRNITELTYQQKEKYLMQLMLKIGETNEKK